MPTAHQHPYQEAVGKLLLLLALPLLGWTLLTDARVGLAASLFWQHAAEFVTVVVAMLVFITGYRAILSARKGAVVLLGVCFLGVGLLDLLHALSHPGMVDAVSPNSVHKATFFWLAARLLAALALLVYVLLPAVAAVTVPRKRLDVAFMLMLVAALGALGLGAPETLPPLADAAGSVTPLAQGLVWVVVAGNLTTAALLWWRRHVLADECLLALALSIGLAAASMLFVAVPAWFGQAGNDLLEHLYLVASYLFLFHATFNEALQRPLEQLEAQRQRELMVINAAPDGVLWVDEKGRILMANPAVETLTGYGVQELVGQSIHLFLPKHLRAGHAHSVGGYFAAPRSRAMGMMDLQLVRRDGCVVPVDISLGHWKDGDRQYAIAYVRDQTGRKKYEESLRHQATHDELTGLPNRWLFDLQLKQTLGQARRTSRHVAVLFIDLDDFKTVNDGFGHGAGDELLVQVGQRLRGVLRDTDLLARLGGDEFAILLSDMEDTDEAVRVAEKVLSSLDAGFRLTQQDVHVGGSIGLAFFPDDAQDSENLLRYADMAMYQAKQAGRGAYACYSVELDRRSHENLMLHTRLKEALAHDGLKLMYQPQVDIASGRVTGVEALLRWQDAVLGDVSPARFIPVAETTGLILPLSDWVLEVACRQIASWHGQGLGLRVAVNFSAQQFRQRDLAGKVGAVLQRTGAPAGLLQIELTESVAMSQPVQAREQLDALVALGCSVALDDFGTGYSSLAYLKALPVSKLKIDRGFIKDLPEDVSSEKIARSIIALAHSLGLTLVAEGVETDAQLTFLRQYGCETYQGWLYAKAMEPDDLMRRLQ